MLGFLEVSNEVENPRKKYAYYLGDGNFELLCQQQDEKNVQRFTEI